jgi:energy-converting hydrogenase Eha subunit F
MLNKLNQLSFVIGVFFIVVALILLIGYFISTSLHANINLYTGIGMIVFGIFMINVKE